LRGISAAASRRDDSTGWPIASAVGARRCEGAVASGKLSRSIGLHIVAPTRLERVGHKAQIRRFPLANHRESTLEEGGPPEAASHSA